MESAGYLTLGPRETAALKKLLSERSYSGVFVQGSFTTGDADALGLDIDPETEGGGGGGPSDQQLRNQSQMEYDAGMLPAHLALVAPDLTPGHNSPISTSEAQRVIGPQEQAPTAPPLEQQQYSQPPAAAPQSQPSAQPQSTAESRALSMLNFGGLGGPSLTEGALPSASEPDLNVMARNLAESRRRKNKAAKPARNAGGPPPSSEEGRRLASEAAAKLAGL